MNNRTLIPNLLDRSCITLLAGASHAGKTTLLAQLVKAIGMCTPNSPCTAHGFIGFPVPVGLSVCYVLAGDAKPWQDTLDTFEDIGAQLDPARISTSLEYPVHNPHTSADLLIATLAALPASDLYIIEGLTAFISPITVINYHAPLTGLKQLTAWATAHRCSILGTHHLGKLDGTGKPRRPLDRVLGTTALVGNVSHTAVLETPEEIKLPTYRLTLYHRRHPASSLTLTRADSPGGPFEVTLSEEAADKADFLRSIPQDSEIHIKELYQLGSSERTVKRWVQELMSSGEIVMKGRGMYQRVGD